MPHKQPKKNIMNLSQQIKQQRLLNNLTQLDVCKALNLNSVVTVSNWENNRSKPTLNQLLNLVDKLGFSFDLRGIRLS